MAKTPHLPPSRRYGAAGSPLPLSEGRGESPRSRYLLPSAKAFAATSRDYPAPKIVFVICLLAVAARLVFINQPYVDHWSWRQSDVAAIARNFLQNGFRFGYPQIDWAGNAPGYVGTEFPILPFIAAVYYKFAGVHEWIGRIQAVILFAVSLPFFFLLVREIFESTAAVWAIFFYCFTPLNVFAGRSFMPDVPSLSFAIVGLYFFLRWVQHGESWSFFVAAIAISLSLLIKITSIVILAPLVYLAVAEGGDLGPAERSDAQGSRGQRPRLQVILFFAIALLPSAIWYWHAHQIAQKFYPHHFFGAGGIRIESFSWYWHIAQQTLVSSLTPLLSLVALIGLFVPQSRDRRYSRLFHWWLAAMIVFIIVVGYGNRHRWYQLPLVPIAAALCRRRLCLYGSKISSRVWRHDIVDFARAVTFLILAFCLCSTVLPIIRGATSRCRSGIEKSDTARCVDRSRGYGRSDHFLPCRAQGLAFSRAECDLQRQPGRQRAGNRES